MHNENRSFRSNFRIIKNNILIEVFGAPEMSAETTDFGAYETNRTLSVRSSYAQYMNNIVQRKLT